jgi:glucose dehydrogenase
MNLNRMKALTLAGAALGALVTTALTPARAADMTFDRALNASKEPQNWILHHGNYQGHRFSQLKEINTDTVKNLNVAFTVALGGFEGAGTRYKFGNLEATPIVEDGVMYVPDGWGTVYAIDVSSGKKGMFKWRFDPERPTRPGPAMSPAAASTTAEWRSGRTRSSRSRSTGGCSPSTRRRARRCGSAGSQTPISARRSRWPRSLCATWQS